MLVPLLGVVPMLGWCQCQTIRTPQEGPCRPANRRRPPTAPPIRLGIAVGVVAVGNPYASRPPRCMPLCPHRRRTHRAPPSASPPSRRAPCPHRAHRTLPASPSASRPSHAARAPIPRVAAATRPWLARIAPHAFPFRRMREKGPLPGNICAKCMLLEIKMARSSPYASISRRNRAIQDTWRANLAIKASFSRRGPGNHAWREDVASAARPFAAAVRGPRACELAERALLPAARAWSACRTSRRPRCPPPAPRLHACHPRPPSSSRTQQTSGTVQRTLCGHKNGIPERGSH